jgi:catechol 2,3-dioxygenase-like lactoylglutathione lyase family enzyme
MPQCSQLALAGSLFVGVLAVLFVYTYKRSIKCNLAVRRPAGNFRNGKYVGSNNVQLSALVVPELSVSDLSKSVTFYIDILGFSELYGRVDHGFIYLGRYDDHGGGAELMLEQFDPAVPSKWGTGALEPPLGRGLNFQIQVADADALHTAIVAAAWPLFAPLEEVWYRRGDHEVCNRQFLVQDPDGYVLRFFHDLGERPLKGTEET